MKKLMGMMDKVTTSKGGDSIYIAIHIDRFTKKKSLIFIIKMKNGGYTPPIFRPLLKTKLEDMDFLVEYGESIEGVDQLKVSMFIDQNYQCLKKIEGMDRMSIKEVFKIIYQYCIDNAINSSDGYYNIVTKDFDDIIVGCGHKPLYIKGLMVQSDMLQVTPGRTYDYNKKLPVKSGKGNAEGNDEKTPDSKNIKVSKKEKTTENKWCIRVCKADLLAEIKDDTEEKTGNEVGK